MTKAPVLLVSHGAATLTTRSGDPLDTALRRTSSWLLGVRATVVVSAHDVRDEITIGVAPRMVMQRDHPAAVGLSWETAGAADVADGLSSLLRERGLSHRKGAPFLDHGAWVPLRALDPAGTTPIVTVSLHASLASELHVALGAALHQLREDGVAIVASGGLTHNQAEFRRGFLADADVDAVVPPSRRFANEVLRGLATADGRASLLHASAHPDFAFCHPTLEHWLPVLVAIGAAQDEPGTVLHDGFQHSLSTAMVGFGRRSSRTT